MEFKEFTEEIKINLSGLLGPGKEVFLQKNIKNNDTVKVGVVLKDKDENIALTIYLEEYYEMFQEGETIDTIIDDILFFSTSNPTPNVIGEDLFQDFSNASQKLIYKLVDKEANEEFLKLHPNRMFHNMAIVYCLLLDIGEKGCLSVTVRNEHLEGWKKAEEDLYFIAHKNTEQMLPVKLSGLNTLVNQMMGDLGISIPLEDNDAYILTNQYCYYGAATLLYKGTLEMIYEELGTDYYILPTCVHEALVIPKLDSDDIEEVDKMREEIILDLLSENMQEDILSRKLFYYENGAGMIQYI